MKLPFAYSHGKIPQDCKFVLSGHSVEEIVAVETNAVAILGVAGSRPSVLLVCTSANSFFCGNQSSNEVSHEIILLGSGTILK